MKSCQTILVVMMILSIYSKTPCSPNCQQCDQSGMCYICGDNYQSNVFGQCISNNIDKCLMYGPSNQCLGCQPTYQLQNQKCVKNYHGCLSQGNPNQCIQCGFGTILQKNACIGVINCLVPGLSCQKCAEGYKLQGKICKDSSVSCLQVRPSDGLCLRCKEGHFLSGYRCIQNKFKNSRCYIQLDSEKCIYCKKGYNLQNNKCLLPGQMHQQITSEMGGVKMLTDLETSNIHNQFNFNMVDQTTQLGFGPNTDMSFGAAPNIQNCLFPDPVNGGCMSCVQGYYPKENKCAIVSSLCDGYNPFTGECLNCKFNLQFANGKCVDNNCEKLKQDKCEKCKKGFRINQNNVCIQFDQHCVQLVNNRCQSCKEGFYINIKGKCLQLPPHCAAANMENGICLQCKKDYQMVAPGSPCTKQIQIQNCEVKDKKNIGKCLICKERFFPQGNRCQRVSNFCKDYNPQNGKCTTCSVGGMVLQQGKCVDVNCITRTDDICSLCKQGFLYSSSNKVCKFNDPNCKNPSMTGCVQCKNGFYITMSKNCKQLPLNCQEANQLGVCRKCIIGFQIYQNNCIKTLIIANCMNVDSFNIKCLACNNRFFASGSNCVPVNPNCENYNQNNGACLSCKSGLSLQSNGQCLSPPPPPLPPNLSQNQQSISSSQSLNYQNQANQNWNTNINQNLNVNQNPVFSNQPQQNQWNQQNVNIQGSSSTQIMNQFNDPNCRQYSENRCTKCSNKFFLGAQQKCVPVNPLCKQSNQFGQCTFCYNGYKLDSGRCVVALPTDNNCKRFQGTVCAECYQGFYYNKNDRVCKKTNPLCKTSNLQNGACTDCYPGYAINKINGNCQRSFKDPNCKDSNQDGTCKVCAVRYYVNQNGKCSVVNPICKQYNPKNGACTNCYPGYAIQGITCVKSLQDNNCKSMQGSICKQCGSRYFLGVDGKCKQANPLCKTFDPKSGACFTCYSGYQILNSNCVLDTSSDPNCKKAQNTFCIECYQGFIAVNGKCNKQNPLCKSTDNRSGGCMSCWPGYILSENNCLLQKLMGVSNNIASDPYCVKAVNGYCVQCSNGYFYSQNQKSCQQLDPTCRSHDLNNGICTGCFNGYSLQNGKCHVTQQVQIPNCLTVGQNNICAECNDRYYLNQQNQCMLVSLSCDTYNNRTGQCTGCAAGHFLQEGKCIYPSLYDQNCIKYDSSAYCSKCRQGFYVSNFLCAEIDRNCLRFDEHINQCVSCNRNMQLIGGACV